MAEMAEESNRMISTMMMIDETYEFSAPRFYDFIKGETEEEVIKAELWFDSALTYAPSPCMPRIRTGRSFTVESLCSFNEADQIMQKTSESSHPKATDSNSEAKAQGEVMPAETKKQEVTPIEAKEQNSAQVSADKVISEDDKGEGACTEETGRVCAGRAPASVKIEASDDKSNCKSSVNVGTEACTPKPTMTSRKGDLMTDSKKHQTAKKIASLVRNPSALKPRNQSQSSNAKSIKPSSVKRETTVKNPAGTPNLAQENQAIKRQKLEGGKTRQILNVKPQLLPHKSKLGLTSGTSNLCSSAANKTNKEDRKVYVREPAKPFVSMAEMMKKFESSTRDLSLPVNTSLSHMKARLTLTRPKDPELETAQRVRSIRVKSTAELEEEMMAKIPKFRARPLNKKILEARTLPAIPRTTPQPPEFQEFHLETMARANQNAESASVASTELSHQNNPWKPHLTAPKSPLLQTLLRARPPRVKSSFELEKEELEKLPKFKAKPLNKKIFESKGDLGMFCNAKKHVTVPQEFHFATDERIPPPVAVVDLFDKLSLNSEPRHDNPIPRNTTPNPFHLHTEERGAEKERRLYMELMQKQLEEERARVPRANSGLCDCVQNSKGEVSVPSVAMMSRRSRYSRSPTPHRRYRRSVSKSVSRSRSRSRSLSSDVENPGNNLYVTGLSPRITKRELEKHFASEGKVMEVHLVVDPWTRESRGFGFVTMASLEEAERCVKYLNHSVLEGRVITVEKARRRRGRTPTPGRYLGLRTIHVRHRSTSYSSRRSPSYSPRRSPSYSPYPRGWSRSPRYSYERSRSRSYSPYYRRRRSYSPYYDPRRSYSSYYRRRSYSRSQSPHSRSPVSWRDRSYSPDDRYSRRHRYCYRSVSRSVSPRPRRMSRRSYSSSVSPGPRSSRRSYSRSPTPRARSTRRRSYSRSISPKLKSSRKAPSSRRGYSRSYSRSPSRSSRSVSSRSDLE